MSRTRSLWERLWRHAACAGEDTERFYATMDEHGSSAATAAVSRRAIQELCNGCAVVEECLEVGLSERDGVWGGMMERERKELRRRLGMVDHA